jgi:hypothetical protein
MILENNAGRNVPQSLYKGFGTFATQIDGTENKNTNKFDF